VNSAIHSGGWLKRALSQSGLKRSIASGASPAMESISASCGSNNSLVTKFPGKSQMNLQLNIDAMHQALGISHVDHSTPHIDQV
jgi:hypothetical protein